MALQLDSYRFSENDLGAEVCLLVQSGVVQIGQTFRAGYGSFGVSASESIVTVTIVCTVIAVQTIESFYIADSV